ncbi:hypothetical protein GJ007_22115 [Salmonella enterica]|nr:hypothetical protein [Salmonella enterica]
MKLTREATTAANPDLRGRKHHFMGLYAGTAEISVTPEFWRLAVCT